MPKYFFRGGEARNLLNNPQDIRHNLQMDHSLSGITDNPDLTVSIRLVIKLYI